MSPRKFLNFLRSRTGLLLLFMLALCALLIIANSRKGDGQGENQIGSKSKTAGQVSTERPQLLQRITRQMIPFRPPAPEDNTHNEATTASSKKSDNATPSLPPISIFAESPSQGQKPKVFSEDFAPFGRLIPCELIVTVDSSSINTPVIGLVTEDVYHHGHVIIPAGTEVHGTAQVDHTRERIASDGRWNLVWQTGEELRVTGLALDRDQDADGNGWGITDGSAGLRGRVIKTDDLAEIKLFAATLLSGAASAFTETQSTPFGSVISPSLTNVPLLGAQSVLDRYAEQIEQGIERDGFYVRVPAGKQFYLYVTQTLDRADAKIGGEPVAPTPTPSPAEARAPVAAPSKSLGSFSSTLPLSTKFIIQPNP
jgi:hypothetical protein